MDGVDVGEVTWVRETPRAVLYDFGDGTRWVPKSQTVSGPGKGATGRLSVSTWLAPKLRRRAKVYLGEQTLLAALRPFAAFAERNMGPDRTPYLCDVEQALGEDLRRAAEAVGAHEALVLLQGPPPVAGALKAKVTVARRPERQGGEPTSVTVRVDTSFEGGGAAEMSEFFSKVTRALQVLGCEVEVAEQGEPPAPEASALKITGASSLLESVSIEDFIKACGQ